MRRIKWTPENDARLRELFGLGLTDRQIAVELGAAPGAIEARRHDLRLLRKPRPRPRRTTAQQKLVAAIGTAIGWPRWHVAASIGDLDRYTTRKYRPMTADFRLDLQ